MTYTPPFFEMQAPCGFPPQSIVLLQTNPYPAGKKNDNAKHPFNEQMTTDNSITNRCYYSYRCFVVAVLQTIDFSISKCNAAKLPGEEVWIE